MRINDSADPEILRWEDSITLPDGKVLSFRGLWKELRIRLVDDTTNSTIALIGAHDTKGVFTVEVRLHENDDGTTRD